MNELSKEIKELFEKGDDLSRSIITNLESFTTKASLRKDTETWKKVKLGEVADIQWGDTNTTKAAYKSSGYIAFSATGPDGFMDHYDFDRDGVVLSAIGANCGETWFAHGKWSCIKNTIRFWGIDGKAHTRFLYYITHNKKIWPIRGSAQPFISQTDAQNMEILIPSYAEQKRIVDFLSPFDEKIETNQSEDNSLAAFRNLLISRLMNGDTKL